MPRPQFTIRTLLWLTLVVGAFLGGSLMQYRRAMEREQRSNAILDLLRKEVLRLVQENRALDQKLFDQALEKDRKSRAGSSRPSFTTPK